MPLLRIARVVFNSCVTLQKGYMDRMLGKRIIVNVAYDGSIR